MAAPFSFVPFGAPAPEGAVACDGLVDGALLDLSHWRGNRTPNELKADTSVEIALAYARVRERDVAHVVNNHFDTDGVLAVWSLLDPEAALAHADALVAAAECGDFDEWPADPHGIWLDAAIARLASGRTDASAYDAVLPQLETLVRDIGAREDLWGETYRELVDAERRAKAGDIVVERASEIAIIVHRPGVTEAPGPLLSRLAPRETKRWLLAFEEPDRRYRYRYEMRRWSWAETVRRPALRAPSRNALAARLGPGWALKGGLGMSGILRTLEPIGTAPPEIARRLLDCERFADAGNRA